MAIFLHFFHMIGSEFRGPLSHQLENSSFSKSLITRWKKMAQEQTQWF